ncbi:MAG: histidine kinase, partial [Lachnospiraceae bacterium]|nr:histidine kinase [Lachnospiraceae bacterium]
RTYDDVLRVLANQVILLLDKDVIIYPVEDKKLGKGYIYAKDADGNNSLCMDNSESEIVKWVFDNKKRAGATTKIYPKAKCLYMAIRINDTVYGIMGIHVERKNLSSFEYSILLSILGECALALKNLDNEKAKEEAAVIAQNEKLRANLLRTISHDLRTPLTSISGNASNLCSHYKMLDDETKERMFSDIYDDSEWLIRLVENLLSVTRIENGEMRLNKSVEVVDDVVDEALKHIDRNKSEHEIKVCRPKEIVIANMDAKLIAQVIINIVNNAIKYTQTGSSITISFGNEGKNIFVKIADNGPGMDKKTKELAFDMFYTGQNKIADGKRSMGLGLALCKSVVEAHGGSIGITDNLPSGCIFTFYLEKGDIEINE